MKLYFLEIRRLTQIKYQIIFDELIAEIKARGKLSGLEHKRLVYSTYYKEKIEGNIPPSPKSAHVVIGAQSNDHSAHLAGVSSKQFFTDADTFARVQLLVTEYYGLDLLSNFWDVYSIKAEALGQKLVYPPGGIPDIDRTRPLIRTPSDLDRLSPPDPYRSGRKPWIRQFCKIFLEQTGNLERVYFTAPFSAAVNIRGYENLALDMFERPGFVHR